MRFVLIISVFASLLTPCGSTQSTAPQTGSTAPYTLYENSDVLAVYQTMPRGTFIKTLSGPRRTYKVSTPLEDGKRYRVTVKVPNNNTSEIKEVEIIAHTQL